MDSWKPKLVAGFIPIKYVSFNGYKFSLFLFGLSLLPQNRQGKPKWMWAMPLCVNTGHQEIVTKETVLIFQWNVSIFVRHHSTRNNVLKIIVFRKSISSVGAMTLPSRLAISTPNITAFYMHKNSQPAFHIPKISFSSLHFYLITTALVPYLPFPFPPRIVCRCSLS